VTCIVAVRDRKRGIVIVGGDSAGVEGYYIETRSDPKVFRNGPYAIGYTSSFRMGQLLQHRFDPPEPPRTARMLHGFMVREFAEAARTVVKAGGYAKVENNKEEGGTFIVAVGPRVFVVYDDFQVAEPADPFAAVGCGDRFALGALRALPNSQPARTRCMTALKIAERSSCGVRRPFRFVTTDPR
jgi:hypothetical protein